MASASSIPFLSAGISILTAFVAMVLVVYKNQIEFLSPTMMSIIILITIPLTGYLLTFLGTSIYQYEKCKKMDMKSNAISSLAVLGSLGVASSVLGFENVPIFKYVFGEYAPRNPLTGEEYPSNSTEYMKAIENENHYKIQWFSNIVKSALPVYVSESVKDGFAYAYWIFFLTLLPSYFLMSLQSAC
jgi:hypothetical protein